MKVAGASLIFVGLAIIAASGYWFPVLEVDDDSAHPSDDTTPRDLTPNEKELVTSLQSEVEEMTNEEYGSFIPVTVKAVTKKKLKYLDVNVQADGGSLSVLLETSSDGSATVVHVKQNTDKRRGGKSDRRKLTETEHDMISGLKNNIQQITQTQYATFNPLLVQVQVVAGLNYFVWIHVGDEHQYLYATIHKPPGDSSPVVSSAKMVPASDVELPSATTKKVGGASDARELKDEERELVLSVKGQIEEVSHTKYEIFKPLLVMTQVVAGMNYFVKIDIGNKAECLHVRIYKPLGGAAPSVAAVKQQLSWMN
eukprot:TRINITY_DN20451_c0_g1_i1.p1 TRINITY_DN20451_c0_g1~~TRINITY_DN20451_c0_g1_i1.p1  ORF type:complete len:311 (+),score=57.62 TRINITY_DN20451_c0_g1_i1:65-997(+)